MIKLLALDLNDTCLNWYNRITTLTMQALKKAAANGVKIVFATGRPYESLPHQLKKETFFRYIISSNGAIIVDRKTHEVIYQSYNPLDTSLALLKKAKELRLGLIIN